MCGIAGTLRLGGHAAVSPSRITAGMTEALAARGPDGEALWSDPEAGIALGHRRLAIVGTGAEGAQPLESRDGRYVIAFNGMIYNYRGLVAELAARGDDVDGRSDTAVLVETIAAFGLEAALPRLHGMFSFALWDRRAARLTLVRDRFGQKPLCFHGDDRRVAFASTLDGLAPALTRPRVSPAGLRAYLALGCLPDPLSIVAGVEKVPPGGLVAFRADGSVDRRQWYDREAALAGADATDLSTLIPDVAAEHLVADVPVGLFLSGGIDSTAIAALAARSQPGLPAYTLAFDRPELDESAAAGAVARALGLDHRLIRSGLADLAAALPRLVAAHDEPFADEASLPTLLLAEAAQSDVKVVLTGDGGDEALGGYTRHRHLDRLAGLPRGLAFLPRMARRFAGSPRRRRHLEKAADAMAAPGLRAAYVAQFGYWHTPDLPAVGWPEDGVRLLDLLHYLPHDGFTKIDRTTMASGLEARPPLADHRVLTAGYAARGSHSGHPKQVLIDLAARSLDPALLDRPKTGFTVPVADLLRGPLSVELAEALKAIPWEGWGLDAGGRRTALGRGDDAAARPLWALMMLGKWSEKTGIALG
ncbi:MAG: asparagine synthase (glutamine-hydrolyzing) [Alphaproteobacteria bacterium]|nr:asparagine synthase (glutamine-hydrolyzing) [Alphaproteobacteria bacterium]